MNDEDQDRTTGAQARPISNGMRVLIFSTAYFPFVGGAEVAVKELTDRLGGEITFDLITPRMRADLLKFEKIGAVGVYRIGFGFELLDKLLAPFLGALLTLRLQRKHQYKAYWCIMASFASGAAYIANWFQKKVPIVLTLQEGDSEDWLQHRWFGLIDLSWRLALERATVLTAISSYLIERAKKHGFKGESFLIPNGVNLKTFGKTERRIFNPEEVTLITTSRLVEKNGVADIIKALPLLPSAVRLEVVGAGPLETSLKTLAKDLGVSERVMFKGLVSPEEIPQHLSHADIFVRPSLSEGQGISFIEAMAAGLPVVATPVGGIPDFVTDGETGVLCEPGNPRSIAAAIARLIQEPELREKVAGQAREMVRQRYDWDLLAQEMKSKVFAIS